MQGYVKVTAWTAEGLPKRVKLGCGIVVPPDEVPTFEDYEAWTFGSAMSEAPDGCIVDPDGTCPHGYPSWLRIAGLV